MYKVIIADDEPKVCQLIKNLIQWESLNLEHIATAQDGICALELIKEHSPDIVITDIRMPGYDGIELIKHAKEVNPDIDFIIISGYQHFDYAHNAIKYGVKDYLLKPLNKNEINATLYKMTEKYSERHRKEMHYLEDVKRLKSNLLQSIYDGACKAFSNGQTLLELNKEYGTAFEAGYYQAIIIKPDFEYQSNRHEMLKMLLNKLLEIIVQHLKDKCVEVQSLLLEDRIFTIVNYKEENKKAFRKALNSIIDEGHLLRDIFKNLMLTIGLGNVQMEHEGLLQSTMEAKRAIQDRIVMGAGKICQYNSELHSDSIESLITFERRRKLIGFIEAFDNVQIKTWIDEIEIDVIKINNKPGRLVLDTINEILEVILFALKNHANVKVIDKGVIDGLYESLQMQSNIHGVFDIANRYINKMLQQIIDSRKVESKRPIKEAQKYINEHYASPITLEEVSAIVGFNATYFSTLFKKETSMNFLEYVTTVRIKAAKQLLVDSKKNILEISHEVGYNDFKHFTKQFKKVTSLTPSEYRKLYY